jgi:hypothetical protein
MIGFVKPLPRSNETYIKPFGRFAMVDVCMTISLAWRPDRALIGSQPGFAYVQTVSAI